jgi:hypothetical protein
MMCLGRLPKADSLGRKKIAWANTRASDYFKKDENNFSLELFRPGVVEKLKIHRLLYRLVAPGLAVSQL